MNFETIVTARRASFTVVELIVVILVAIILMAVLVPVTISPKTESRRAACMSNLHQFDMAIATYMVDNNEAVPAHLTKTPNVVPRLFRCPSDEVRSNAASIAQIEAAPHSYSSYNYWSNAYVCSATTSGVACFAIMAVCDKNGSNDATQEANGFGGNHAGAGGHVLFSDHSLKWVSVGGANHQWGTAIWGTNWVALGKVSEY